MIKVMFVCHGNICRSPMAEFVMKDKLKAKKELKRYKNTNRKTRCGGARPIKQIDAITGDVVAYFPSTAEASRQTGIKDYNIHFCLKGKLTQIGGFKFVYA